MTPNRSTRWSTRSPDPVMEGNPMTSFGQAWEAWDDASPVDYAAALAACTDNELSFLAEQSITLAAVRDEGVAEFGEALYRGVNRERMLRLRGSRKTWPRSTPSSTTRRGVSDRSHTTQNVGSGRQFGFRS